jgi:hypothetical protein
VGGGQRAKGKGLRADGCKSFAVLQLCRLRNEATRESAVLLQPQTKLSKAKILKIIEKKLFIINYLFSLILISFILYFVL